MPDSSLSVRSVRGRYGRGRLKAENIEAQVTEIGRIFKIRLDDAANPEAWQEIVVEVETGGEPCVMNSAVGLAS
jgi:hypothetical protein